MKIFNSIGHFFAWVFGQLPAAEKDILALEAVVASPLAKAIVALGGPKAAAAQAAIQAIAGDVLVSFQAAGAAIGAGGLNVTFDIATVKALEALFADVKEVFSGQSAPVGNPQAIIKQ